ncbi:substrate-binding periplasmic protein [Pseudoduganella aquatica]|uniref:Transporter substrate-binding domain-containing protein n=1 Tax=Pseudoduganella aquatica TaxID=2660641 RepID=A0A7X4H7R8_9BURK|nr:transporter substrate-binding domain-containing protein [Pseudoduganella aquatica]MYN06284.1 transporter substrate-binding domain-containing protein [Pseudoduganella aquatica]
MNARRLTTFATLCCVLPGLAAAACSRTINVPVAPHGMAIVVKHGKAAGVMPDMLDELGDKYGCKFTFPVVPRARLEMLFRASDADVIVLSTRSPERDLSGTFVPVFKYRAVLVGVKPIDPSVQSVDTLLKNTDLRIAVVRGFDYGPAYRKLLEPAQAARVQYANDLNDLMRRMQANIADVTILPYSSAYNTIVEDPRLSGLDGQLSISALEDVPWQDAGFYVSTRTLLPADQAVLIDMLGNDEIGKRFLKSLSKVIPPAVLNLTAKRH